MDREDVRDGHAGRGLDLVRRRRETAGRALARAGGPRCFSRAHQADEHDRALAQSALGSGRRRTASGPARRLQQRGRRGECSFIPPSYHAGAVPCHRPARAATAGACLRSPAHVGTGEVAPREASVPTLLRFLFVDRRSRRPRLRGDVRARDPRRAGAARDDGDDPGLAPCRPAMSGGAASSALFLDMLAAERGAAANTLDAYRRDLDDYLAFLAARPASTPAEAEPAAVRAFMASLEERGLKASSAARRLSAVRQFHKFLYVEGYAAADPTAPRSAPKRGRSPAEGAVRRARSTGCSRSPRERARRRTPPPAARLRAARMALPAGAALRHGPAGLRARGAAAQRGEDARALPRRQRQGRPRSAWCR